MKPKLLIPDVLHRLHAELTRTVRRNGLRPTGRLLGDEDHTNAHAMRLHRMLKSPVALGLAPFYQVLRVCRTLGISLRV